MLLAALALAGLAWWLHGRGELVPLLKRWGLLAAGAAVALRLLETGRWQAALLLAGGGFFWWRWQQRRPAKAGDAAAARQLLGLAPGADATAIQAAWRARMAACHPDAGGDTASAQALTAARDLLLQQSR
jgi:hypothetical protein